MGLSKVTVIQQKDQFPGMVVGEQSRGVSQVSWGTVLWIGDNWQMRNFLGTGRSHGAQRQSLGSEDIEGHQGTDLE